MRIITQEPGRIQDWIVVALWHGKERKVYGPQNFYRCARWVAAQKGEKNGK